MSNQHLTIHGHFYQPPRENPWTEEIELQKSAHPFHDWNERIHHECYLPNTRARLLDDQGLIVDIVNNFESISFNFGPTLMSWLKDKHPEAHASIVEADARSAAAHGGHGNAIAQVYNHIIMPLAPRRDKTTQVRWGAADFRRTFGRDPEAIWLAETACDEETLEVLVEEGMRWLILSPYQAQAVRALDANDWHDVSKGEIDPKQPYRCFLKSDPAKFIDIFFYDGPVSKAVGFEDVLFDAKRFMDRIESAARRDTGENQLVSLATDGETFGHHKAFGDRVLAYLLNAEAKNRGFKIVNFGEYLEAHAPRFAVVLKDGEGGEGTAWSCPHGTRRWKDHCGCRGGGPGHWNQHWRKPLRAALDRLKAKIDSVFEEQGAPFFKDVWQARNAYVQVVLDRSEETARRFFAAEVRRPVTKAEMTFLLKLLEMQRHAMLMYTSCGWFFSEISGLETVQILQYAARALELAEETGGRPLEEEFLSHLAEAKSNIAELKDGRGVYEKYVRPSRTKPAKIVSQYAILSIFEAYPERFRLGCFDLEVFYQRKEPYGNLAMNYGRIRVTSRLTLEEHDFGFIVLQFGVYDFRCSVKPLAELGDHEKVEKDLFECLHSGHVVDLLRKIDAAFGGDYYDLKDMFLAERQKILSVLSKEALDKINDMQEMLYDQSRRMNEIYRSINLPIPDQIRYAAAHTLSNRLEAEVRNLAQSGFDSQKFLAVGHIIEVARKFDVDLRKENVAEFLSQELARRTRALLADTTAELATECLDIDKLARKIGIEIEKRAAQDDLFELLKGWRDDAERLQRLAPDTVDRVFELAGRAGINPAHYREQLNAK